MKRYIRSTLKYSDHPEVDKLYTTAGLMFRTYADATGAISQQSYDKLRNHLSKDYPDIQDNVLDILDTEFKLHIVVPKDSSSKLTIMYPDWVTKFQVKNWKTDKVIAEFDTAEAREAWVQKHTYPGYKYRYFIVDNKIDFTAPVLYDEV